MWVANEDAKKSQQHQKIFLPIKDTMRKAGKTAQGTLMDYVFYYEMKSQNANYC